MAARIFITLALSTITVVWGAAAQTPDPGAVLDEAQRLADAGQYEKALQKFIWFHEHALEINEARYYGVRLSFALSDWAQLGERYPKALEAMKAIRDRDAAKLLGGDGTAETLHDVQAINDALGQGSETLPFFRRLSDVQPALASECWRVFEPTAIAAGEYALARRFIKDPEERFLAAKQKFEQEGSRDGGKSREFFLQIFADDVSAMIQILAGNGEDVLAKKFETAAIAVAKDRRVEVAVKHARQTGNHRRAGGSKPLEQR